MKKFETFDEAMRDLKRELLTEYIPPLLGFAVLGAVFIACAIALAVLALRLAAFAGLYN